MYMLSYHWLPVDCLTRLINRALKYGDGTETDDAERNETV